MDEHFGMLLGCVQDLIERAMNTKIQAQTIHRYFMKEKNTVDKKLNFGTPFELLFENRGWKGEQMRRDLEVATVGLHTIENLLGDLEITRYNLITYRKHIKYFQVNIPSYDLTDIQGDLAKEVAIDRTPEELIAALSEIIDEFEASSREKGRTGNQITHQ